jgi:hypothetical protein
MTEIGAIQMSYLIQPCGLDGTPINGGNHYANASTPEDAREIAERWLTAREGKHLGYVLGSVSVYGREMRLGYQAWEEIRGGRRESFTVTRAEMGLPAVFLTRETHCWDTTVLDYAERVHAMMSDGSCQCGNPAAGYGGRVENNRRS